MPVEGHDIAWRDVPLEIVVTDRLAEEAAFVGEEKTFVRIEVPTVASDARVDRIEQ